MTKKHNTALIFAGVIILVFGYFYIPAIIDRYEWWRAARAVVGGTCPNLFGGNIKKVTPCIIDPGIPSPGTCSICPFCTEAQAVLGVPNSGACQTMTEIVFRPAGGSQLFYMCPSKTYKYVGGGTMPMIKADIMGCAVHPAIPLIVALSPGPVYGQKIEKIKSWFNDYIIAGFKN